LAHFLVDSYGAFLPPLLPAFKIRFGINKFRIGALAAAQSTTVSLIQPLLGFASDRLQTRKFLVLGPAVSGIFYSLIGNAPSYWWLVVLSMAGGLGSGSLHPASVSLAGEAGSRRRHLALSLWSAGGLFGAATGFYLAATVTDRLGLGHLGYAMVPGILTSIVLYILVPRRRASERRTVAQSLHQTTISGPLRLLFGIGLCRALVTTAITTFVPILLAEQGYRLSAGGNVLSVFILFGVCGNLLGGWTAERIGTRGVIFLSPLLAFPALVGFTLVHGPAHLFFLIATSIFLFASAPVEISLAQRILPQHSAAVSGVFTGATWGIAGISMIAAGALADRFGTQNMMLFFWLFSLVAAMLAAALPRSSRQD
jgi:FSR family fosmidomycin resistance protein-like MFS transporter